MSCLDVIAANELSRRQEQLSSLELINGTFRLLENEDIKKINLSESPSACMSTTLNAESFSLELLEQLKTLNLQWDRRGLTQEERALKLEVFLFLSLVVVAVTQINVRV